MRDSIPEFSSSDSLLSKSRYFWHELAQKMIKESIQAIDNTAKQIITVTGIIEGLYFHAIAFSDVKKPIQDTLLLAIYSGPVLIILCSLVLAILVFFPKTYTLNFNSSEASQLLYTRIVKRKHILLRVSLIFLVIGVLSIFIAVLTYLQS